MTLLLSATRRVNVTTAEKRRNAGTIILAGGGEGCYKNVSIHVDGCEYVTPLNL